MKSKIKGTKKDININIEIENNLLSKNKMKSDDENTTSVTGKLPSKYPSKSSPPISKASHDVLSDYLAITSARDLYNSNRTQPFNLTQYLNSMSATPTAPEPSSAQQDGDEEPEGDVNDEIPTEAGFELLNKVQDKVFEMSLKADKRARRKTAIAGIKFSARRPSRATIYEYQLAKYVKKYNPTYWSELVAQFGSSSANPASASASP